MGRHRTDRRETFRKSEALNENASGRIQSMGMCLRQVYFLPPKLQDNFGSWKYSNCKAAPAD